jgi:chorismate-pyruvate lyase
MALTDWLARNVPLRVRGKCAVAAESCSAVEALRWRNEVLDERERAGMIRN